MNEADFSLAAHINGKEEPDMLYVHGSVMVYSANAKIDISRSEPQGINPQILLLNITINENGPKKGVPKHFSYQEAVEGHQFNEVTVFVNDSDILLSSAVDYFG